MTNRRIILALWGAAGMLAAGLALPTSVAAAGCTSGDLIRASNPSVYYCGADGKRYVFPNQRTYSTWYPDFSGVKFITDAELASIQIGGNVTYKPGVRMVKITSSPQVYVVAAGGVLRGVPSEDVARLLYGNNWNQQIDDVPDAFFSNYLLGADLGSAADFSPVAARGSATSINSDRLIAVPTTSATKGVSLTLSPNVTTLSAGSSMTVTTTVNDPTGVMTASIFLNDALLKVCEVHGATSATCQATVYGSDYADGATLRIYGQAVSGLGVRTVTDERRVVTSGGTSNDNGVVNLEFSSDDLELGAGESITVTARAEDSAGLSSVSVFVNGVLVQRCAQNGTVKSASCSAVIYANSYATGSTVTVSGQEINGNGTPTLSAASEISVVSGQTVSGTASMQISPDVTEFKTDESVSVIVEAYDTLGFTNVSVFVNGSLLKSCSQSGISSTGRCVATLNGSAYSAGSNLDIRGEATNTDGTVFGTVTKRLAVKAGSVSSGNVSLSFSPYAQFLAAGQTTTVTATASFSHSVTEMRLYVNEVLAKTCTLSGGSSTGKCSVTLSGSSYASGSTVTIYAEADSSGGESGTSAVSSLGITSASSASGVVTLYVAPALSRISGTQMVTVTANAYDPSGLSSVDIYVNGSAVRSCSQSGTWATGASCSYTLSASSYGSGTTLSIYGKGVNVFSSASQSPVETITVE